LRLTLLDEKDRFVLSESNHYETPMKQSNGNQGSSFPQKLPATYRLIHKENKWGQDIKDPLAVRQLTAEEVGDEIILTTKDPETKRAKRELAIQQIEKRFTASKRVKVGVQKDPQNPGVVAQKVCDFVSFIKDLPLKMVEVVCDDVIEDELSNRKIGNNDFMLYTFKDSSDAVPLN